MIRFAFALLLSLAVCAGAKSIDAKISETTRNLKSFDRNYASINAKMAKTAKSILRKERTVLTQRKKIENLEAELQGKTSTLSSSRDELQALTEKQEALEARQKKLRADLAELMARIVSLTMMQDDNNTLSAETIIGEAVFKSLNAQAQKRIRQLESDYLQNRKALHSLTGKTAKLKTEIVAIEKEKRDLEKAKRSNEKALAQLRTKKKGYRKELRKLLAQKQELKKTLSRLNIIQESEAQKARNAAEQRRNEALLASKELPKVKSVGSSYHKARTRRYRGKKTIAPLDSYTVLKRYGTYTDPIYKIKIFNESVSLQPKNKEAKVKAVFNGKVILAQNTPLLENVVIIEHSDG
ncbi:MAG: peptidase M23, partial [Campylobacterales bacterium]